ncbi:MAG: hypothetical protein ABIH64_03835 [Nanoarchaeota archaeon]
MKTSVFILNVVSGIFLLNLLFSNPSITGMAVAEASGKIELASSLGFSVLFIIAVTSLDIYAYLKSKKTK